MGETNSPLVAHVGYDISILSNPLEDYRFFYHWFSGVKTL
jgi:hypothetical protein